MLNLVEIGTSRSPRNWPNSETLLLLLDASWSMGRGIVFLKFPLSVRWHLRSSKPKCIPTTIKRIFFLFHWTSTARWSMPFKNEFSQAIILICTFAPDCWPTDPDWRRGPEARGAIDSLLLDFYWLSSRSRVSVCLLVLQIGWVRSRVPASNRFGKNFCPTVLSVSTFIFQAIVAIVTTLSIGPCRFPISWLQVIFYISNL